MCFRRTWVLRGHERLLLENVLHVAIQGPFWRAAGLGAQELHRVYVRGWKDSGEPARWCTEA